MFEAGLIEPLNAFVSNKPTAAKPRLPLPVILSLLKGLKSLTTGAPLTGASKVNVSAVVVIGFVGSCVLNASLAAEAAFNTFKFAEV